MYCHAEELHLLKFFADINMNHDVGLHVGELLWNTGCSACPHQHPTPEFM